MSRFYCGFNQCPAFAISNHIKMRYVVMRTLAVKLIEDLDFNEWHTVTCAIIGNIDSPVKIRPSIQHNQR